MNIWHSGTSIERNRIFRDAWYKALCDQKKIQAEGVVMDSKRFKEMLINLNCDDSNSEIRTYLKNRLLTTSSNQSVVPEQPKESFSLFGKSKKYNVTSDKMKKIMSVEQFSDNINEIQTIKQRSILKYLINEFQTNQTADDITDAAALRIFLSKIYFDSDKDGASTPEDQLLNSAWMFKNDAMWADFINDNFDPGRTGINARSILNFLFSEENSIIDPRVTFNDDGDGNAQDDYKYSICDYHINSSHNTYLVSDQLWGLSSLEAYAHSLRMGCRCLEIDCWDGDDLKATLQSKEINKEEPIVLHGYTCTSTLLFKDVIRVIARHAFETSEHPVILSIENHCRPAMQSKMSFYMKSFLGEKLLIEEADPVDRNGERHDRLPMLASLKNKVIIKFKKLPEKTRDTKNLVQCWESKNGRNHRENIRSLVGDDLSIYSDMSYEDYQWWATGDKTKKHGGEAGLMSEVDFEKLNTEEIFDFDPDETDEDKALALKIELSMCTKEDLKNLGAEGKKMKKALEPPKPGKLKKSKSAESIASTTSSATSSMYKMDGSMAELIYRNGNDEGVIDKKIARDLSDLVVYCICGHFKKLAKHMKRKIDVRNMCSLAYNVIAAYDKNEHNKKKLINYTANRFLRVYPPGLHFFSANYNPIDCWNIGAHMVALNFQCSDFYLTLSHAKFMHAFKSFGYVRKPDTLIHPIKGLQPRYDGQKHCKSSNIVKYEIEVLGARNVARHIEIDGVSFPNLKLELWGSNSEYHAKTYQGNDAGGLALKFSTPKKFDVMVANNDNANLYIELSETGIYGTKIRLGQCTINLSYIRTGVRSVPLCDRYNQPHPCASLLISIKKVDVRKFTRQDSLAYWDEDIRKEDNVIEKKVNDYVNEWVTAITKSHAEKEKDLKKAGITVDDSVVNYNAKTEPFVVQTK